MSSTRHAPEDGHFRQSRYASSEEFETGLLCNLVAKRCKLLTSAADRALIYFLQQLSHEEGGLEKVAADFLAAFPERIGSPTLRGLRLAPDQRPSAAQWEQLREEGPGRRRILSARDFLPPGSDVYPPRAEPAPPTVQELFDQCRVAAAEKLPQILWIICLDPASKLESPAIEVVNPDTHQRWLSSWWFEDLLAGLHLYRAKYIARAEKAIAQTTISKRIFDDLDYAAHCRGLVVIEGDQRTGKSTAAKNWCDKHPGQAVYVKLGVGNDDATFFRSIAKAVGVAASMIRKPTEMQMKIEDALQDGHLMLVLDEAHFLFAQTQRPRSAPARLDWIRTALVDFNVSVALISTPQFDRACELYEKTLQWNAKQIKGRVKLHTMLPTELPEADLYAVARKMAPQASAASLLRLVGFAQLSDDYLAGIERLKQRADFFAFRDGRETATGDDIKRALDEAVPRVVAPDPAPPMPGRARKRAARALSAPRASRPALDFSSGAQTRQGLLDSSASQGVEFGASNPLQFTEAAALE